MNSKEQKKGWSNSESKSTEIDAQTACDHAWLPMLGPRYDCKH